MSRSLRIALNHTRLGGTGGVEGYITTFLGRLLDAGHEVDYFCHKVFGQPAHEALRVVQLPIWRSPSALRLASFASASTRAIQRAERERAYDVVHGFGKTWYHSVYRDGSGCHADYRALYLDPVKRGAFGRLQSGVGAYDRVMESIEARRFAWPQLVIANSRWVADQIRARHGVPEERIVVIRSGVDCVRFQPERASVGRKTLEQLDGFDPSLRTAVFVSNDHARKGLAELLDGLALLGQVPLQLLVVGHDRHERTFRRHATRTGLDGIVHFLGPRSDLDDLLPACDLFVLPTHFDALPNAVLEAFASGLPVLTSRQTGAAELIHPGENGWLVDAVEPEAIARRLSTFLELAEILPLRQAARRTAEAHGWDEHFEAVEQVYAEAIALKDAERTHPDLLDED